MQPKKKTLAATLANKRFLLACLGIVNTVSVESIQGQSASAATTYSEAIAPIINQNCVTCHRDGGIGPFPLDTFESVKKRARQIVEVAESRYMPPWKPDPGYGPSLVGERRLTDEQLQALRSWLDAGSPPGDLSRLSPAPRYPSQWTRGEPDLIIELEEDYILPAEGVDIYRNFAIPLPIDEPRYVTSFELLPRTNLAIHHALLMLDDTDRSRQRDESEPGPGYDGMGIGSSTPPSGHIVGWTPGQVPYETHPGTAWELKPGTDLVLQLHMLPTGKPTPVNPRIGLYFADTPPSKKSFVLQMRDYDIQIPAGKSDYVVSDSVKLPVDVDLVAVYPHTHYLGKDIQFFATLPNGEKKWLLRISDWDFNWQGDYRYQEAVFLPAGAELHMNYRFDNSADNPRNPSDPPVDVQGGWRSTDEMAELMIQLIPRDQAHLGELADAQRDYDIKLAGGEARYYYFNGIYLERQKETERAAASYQQALALDPSFASAYVKLGAIAESRGALNQAEELYNQALAFQPNLVPANLAVAKLMLMSQRYLNAEFILENLYSENPADLQTCVYLAGSYLVQGKADKALALFDEAKDRFHASPLFHLRYGEALLKAGHSDQAMIELLRVVETPRDISPDSTESLQAMRASAHYLLGSLHLDDGRFTEAVSSLDASLAVYPDNLDALLKSAAVFIQLEQTEKAIERLVALVSKPPEQTFSVEDILANLPMPEGASLLAQAYLKIGDESSAQKASSVAKEALPAL